MTTTPTFDEFVAGFDDVEDIAAYGLDESVAGVGRIYAQNMVAFWVQRTEDGNWYTVAGNGDCESADFVTVARFLYDFAF